MNRHHAVVALWLMGGLGLGCGPKTRKKPSGDTRYTLGTPGDGWTRTRPGGADHAWHNPSLSATIYADSNCAERFDDSELGALLDHVAYGVARGKPVRDEPTRLANRDALVRAWEGSLDGIKVNVGAAVTKKSNCVYDIIAIAPPKHFDATWSAFVRVLEGFETRGDGR